MSIIQAYKSDADGKVFEHKTDYTKHMRKLAAHRRYLKNIQRVEDERLEFFKSMGEVSDFAGLHDFIVNNWKWFFMNGVKHNAWQHNTKKMPEFHQLNKLDIRIDGWREQLSNSHSCPRGGVQNWGSKPGKPTGYPGWYGYIEIIVGREVSKNINKKYYFEGWGSDYFKETLINTGSGGAGGQTEHSQLYSYDIKLWAADFPVMYMNQRKKQYLLLETNKKQHMWNNLGGQHNVPPVVTIPDDWVCPDPLIPYEPFNRCLEYIDPK